MAPNISDTGTVSTHLRLQRLRELLAASTENRGGETHQEIFNALDEIEKENAELHCINEDLVTSCQILRKNPQLFHEALDHSSNSHLETDLEGVTSETDHSASDTLNVQQFRSFAERYQDGFVLADEEGRIIEWNQTEEQMTGLTRAEVLGRSIWDVDLQVTIAAADRDKKIFTEERKAMYKDLITKGKSPSLDRLVEIEIQRPDGSRCNVQMSLFVIPTAKGFLSGSISRDITELKQTVTALEESIVKLDNQKEFISRILESIPSSLIMIDRSMRVVSVNNNFLKKTRRERISTIGHKIDEVFPQVLLEYIHLTEYVQEVFQTGHSTKGVKVAYRAPGLSNRTYYYRLFPNFLSPHPSSDGKTVDTKHVETVMLLMDDVTEYEHLREEARRLERHLASVVECDNDLVVSMDPKGNVITWNRASEVVSGINSKQVKDRSLVSLCKPDQRLVMRSMLAKLAHAGSVQPTEITLLTASHKEVPISWSCSLMRDDSGNVAGVVAVGRDLTELRRMEDKRFNSAKLASLGVMAGGIAHDLRNPLGIISASAQLLLENPRDLKLRAQGLQKIYSATQRASLIIENLLKFARPASGWVMKDINLHAIIDETLALLSTHITSQDVIVSVTYQPDLPRVQGSHQMLQQVFTNLILNACSAMTQGGVLKITVEANSANQVELHFLDTGCGISPENLISIFDPFFTTMPVGKGVGLGLPICHTIIQQHQGEIEVHSEVGKGSDFIVRLPGSLSEVTA